MYYIRIVTVVVIESLKYYIRNLIYNNADDTQLYISFHLSDPTIAIDKVNNCISDIRTWMIQNKLKINDSKTEFLVLTSSFLKQHYNDLNISVGNSRIAPSISARNLGVIFDNHMRLDKQINSILSS